jgi:hypothetical protein
MFTLRCAVGLVLMVSSVACARAAAPPARPSSHKPNRTRSSHAARSTDNAPCVAKYKNKCFASADEACVFAGCADQRCDVLETMPASVSCADMR